jgi:ABC-type amino acid transport substrate-binding protein
MAVLRALVLLLVLVAGAAPAGELRVAIGLAEPATALDDPAAPPGTRVAAMYEDIARELCRRLAASCTLERTPVAAILPGVEQGIYDIGFGPFLHSPERARRFALSDPIWRSASRLVAHRGTAEAFAARLGGPLTLDTLRDAPVAAVAGSAQQAWLVGVAAARRLTLVPARTAAEAVARLDGEADFALLPATIAYELMATDAGQRLEFAGPPESGHGLGGTAHLALRASNEALLNSVNRAIASIRGDGSFPRIVRRHLPVWLD